MWSVFSLTTDLCQQQHVISCWGVNVNDNLNYNIKKFLTLLDFSSLDGTVCYTALSDLIFLLINNYTSHHNHFGGYLVNLPFTIKGHRLVKRLPCQHAFTIKGHRLVKRLSCQLAFTIKGHRFVKHLSCQLAFLPFTIKGHTHFKFAQGGISGPSTLQSMLILKDNQSETRKETTSCYFF